MKTIIYTRSDGGISILVPTPKHLIEQEVPAVKNMTEDQYVEWIKKKDAPVGVTCQIVDDSNIPQDRTFRDAFSESPGQVVIDMPKAREIHLGRIREARDKKLAKLDIEIMKANEQNDSEKSKKIIEEKQKLRDLPAAVNLESIKTPEALKAFWPNELK